MGAKRIGKDWPEAEWQVLAAGFAKLSSVLSLSGTSERLKGWRRAEDAPRVDISPGYCGPGSHKHAPRLGISWTTAPAARQTAIPA
jgi:hypothetical protein